MSCYPSKILMMSLLILDLLLLSFNSHAQVDDAKQYIVITDQEDGECAVHGGYRKIIKNNHRDKCIVVKIDRYHFNKWTGDRSIVTLNPRDQATKLGCSRTRDGGEQSWVLIDAAYQIDNSVNQSQ